MWTQSFKLPLSPVHQGLLTARQQPQPIRPQSEMALVGQSYINHTTMIFSFHQALEQFMHAGDAVLHQRHMNRPVSTQTLG